MNLESETGKLNILSRLYNITRIFVLARSGMFPSTPASNVA